MRSVPVNRLKRQFGLEIEIFNWAYVSCGYAGAGPLHGSLWGQILFYSQMQTDNTKIFRSFVWMNAQLMWTLKQHPPYKKPFLVNAEA